VFDARLMRLIKPVIHSFIACNIDDKLEAAAGKHETFRLAIRDY